MIEMDTRAGKSAKSFVWSTVFVIVTSGMPFIIRTLLIRFWGYEYAGLGSLFNSVLNVLNITELGVGEALVYSLYAPMAKGEIKEANALLLLYKRIYTVIGIIVAIVGCAIIPFLSYLIEGEVPKDINIVIIYVITLANTVGSYLVFSYCHSVFQTNQSLYLTYKYSSINFFVMYVLQIIIILGLHNYYLYAVLLPVFTIFSHCINYLLVKKYYPQYYPEGRIERDFMPDFIKRISGMMIRKFRNQLRGAIDNIVISAVLGLVVLAKFQNYYLIMSVPLMILGTVRSSVLQSLGNSVATETVESNYSVERLYVFITQWFGCMFGTVLLCVFHPMMILWLGDESATFPLPVEVLFVIYFYLTSMTYITDLMRNSTGIWWQGKWIPIVETLLNLTLDIIGVHLFGVFGVLLATIFSLILVNIPCETWCIYKYYFHKSSIKDLLKYVFDCACNLAIGATVYYICLKVSGNLLVELVLKAVLSFLLVNILLFLVNIKNKNMWEILHIFRKIIR